MPEGPLEPPTRSIRARACHSHVRGGRRRGSRLAASTTGAQWDANQGANYFNTVEGGVTVQYWYDDARSLRPKYAAARKAGLRGVGPFEYGDVPPSHEDVWAAFDAFLLP